MKLPTKTSRLIRDPDFRDLVFFLGAILLSLLAIVFAGSLRRGPTPAVDPEPTFEEEELPPPPRPQTIEQLT